VHIHGGYLVALFRGWLSHGVLCSNRVVFSYQLSAISYQLSAINPKQ